MLDQPPRNKMLTNPPAKKEYHFAATGEHFAEVVHAETLQEAEKIYHSIKRLINQPEPKAAALSTPPPPMEEEDVKS